MENPTEDINEPKKSLGHITVGYGTPNEQKLEIAEYIQASYVDHRLVSVALLEDESIVLSVENPESTGRINQSIRVSRESLLGLLTTSFMYFSCKGEDVGKVLQEAIAGDKIEYTFSDNLKPITFNNESEVDSSEKA